MTAAVVVAQMDGPLVLPALLGLVGTLAGVLVTLLLPRVSERIRRQSQERIGAAKIEIRKIDAHQQFVDDLRAELAEARRALRECEQDNLTIQRRDVDIRAENERLVALEATNKDLLDQLLACQRAHGELRRRISPTTRDSGHVEPQSE